MKKFYRSREDQVLGGLCGGIGEMYDVDPTFIRLGVILATLASGVVPLVVTYVIGWAIVPLGPDGQGHRKRFYRSRKDHKLGGLCGGVGEALSIDPMFVRLAVVFAALITAIIPLTLLYIVAWVIVPLAPEERETLPGPKPNESESDRNSPCS